MRFPFLPPEASIEHTFFLMPRFALRAVGCWPEGHSPSVLRVVHFFISMMAVAFGAFGECICGVLTLNELLNSMEAWCPGITKQISLFKMWVFFVQREKLISLIDRVWKLLSEDENVEKRTVVRRLSMIAFGLNCILFTSGNSTNLFFVLRPLMNNAFRTWNGLNTTLDLPFKMILPDVITNYPMYPVTYAYMGYSGLMTVFTFSGVDGFFVGMCFYVTAMFKLIQLDIKRVFVCLHHRSSARVEDNRYLREQLKLIVQRHNEVIDLCAEFRDIFTTIIMGHFLSAALVLCVSVIDLLFNTGIGIVLYISYSIAALSQLFLYCIGGTYVCEGSGEICNTIYLAEWYKCDPETRKMILMIMIRAQRPITVKVPFFAPSLPAFMAILSTTGSYIALMKSFI